MDIKLSEMLKNSATELLESEQSEVIVASESATLMSVFRDCYDTFIGVLDFYSIYRNYALRTGKTGLGEIQKLLIANGVTRSDGQPISTIQISRYLSVIRKERQKSIKAIPSPTHPEAIARNKVAVRSGNPVSLPTLPNNVAIVPNAPYIHPEPIQEMVTITVERIQKEQVEGFPHAWSGQDEFFLIEKIYKHYKENHKSLNPSFWNDIKRMTYKHASETYRPAIHAMEAKLKAKGLWEHYKDMK